MKPGHVFTIEPMICEGKAAVPPLFTSCGDVISCVHYCRWLAGWDMARRLDGGDQRREAVGPVWTHSTGNRDWLRNPDPPAGGQRPCSFPEPNVELIKEQTCPYSHPAHLGHTPLLTLKQELELSVTVALIDLWVKNWFVSSNESTWMCLITRHSLHWRKGRRCEDIY